MARLFGLTGGRGSGRTLAASMFREEGVPIVESDVVLDHLFAPGSRGFLALVRATGAGVVGPDGLIDWPKITVASLVDPQMTARVLERVREMHVQAMDEEAQRIGKAGAPWIGIEASWIGEERFRSRVRPIVAVVASEATRASRLVRSRGLSEPLAQVAAKDLPSRQDLTIDNEAGTEDLRREVRRVLEALERWA
jgi:dephospho-CoA kinase